MLTVDKWIDKVHEITDALEHKSNAELRSTLEKATAYHEGYVQACEDFGREMRRAISNEKG